MLQTQEKVARLNPAELKIKILDEVWGDPEITSGAIIESLEGVVKNYRESGLYSDS